MSAPQRDPLQPFNTESAPVGQPHQQIAQPIYRAEEITPPKNYGPWIISGIGVLLAVAMVVAMIFVQGQNPEQQTSPTLTPTVAPSQIRTPGSNAALPWKHKYSNGTWQILRQEWMGSLLSLEVQVTCDEGYLNWSFFAYANDASEAAEPQSSGTHPYIAQGSCSPGQTVTGYVQFWFNKRTPGMLVLSTPITPISGLNFQG